MTAIPAPRPLPRVAVQAPLPLADPVPDAEAVILGLLAGYFGQDKRGAGLLVKREGRFCTPMCPCGQWLSPGDSLRGGQPCSARCQQIAEAIEMAAVWLQANEHERPQRAARRGKEAEG